MRFTRACPRSNATCKFEMPAHRRLRCAKGKGQEKVGQKRGAKEEGLREGCMHSSSQCLRLLSQLPIACPLFTSPCPCLALLLFANLQSELPLTSATKTVIHPVDPVIVGSASQHKQLRVRVLGFSLAESASPSTRSRSIVTPPLSNLAPTC